MTLVNSRFRGYRSSNRSVNYFNLIASPITEKSLGELRKVISSPYIVPYVPSPIPPEPIVQLESIYKCPYSGQKYKGACQITRCWARIKDNLHGSGCVHQVLNKSELGIFELSYVLNKPRKKIRDRLEVAKEYLRYGVELIEKIEDNKNEIPPVFCQNCGRVLKNGKECLNKIKCEGRKEVIEYFLSLEFFKEFELPLQPVEFNLLLAESVNREQVSHLFDISNQEQQHMEELFHIHQENIK